MSNDANFLLMTILEDVEQLTRPYQVEVMQEHEDPDVVVENTKITLDPLLTQLENAVGSSHSMGGRGATDPTTRNVIDAGALMLLTNIEEDIKGLWETLHPRGPRKPEDNRRAVRLLYVQLHRLSMDRALADSELEKVRGIINFWVVQIENKFDPPVVIEVTRPCPRCRVSFVYDEWNDRVLALSIEWHNSMEKSHGECRACGATWYGQTELRSMRAEIDNADEYINMGDIEEDDDLDD